MKPARNPIKPLTVGFLSMELILYILILTTGGACLVWSSFLSIVLCFIYALVHIRSGNCLMVVGLACTVAADFFLVLLGNPQLRLWGMVCFLAAQCLYAASLYLNGRNRVLLWARAVLTSLAALVAWIILQEKTDALALVSVCYYANLIINIFAACSIPGKGKLLGVGFVLFLLCDTVIGLQVASGEYLPIEENSLLYGIIFMNFNLSWFFYLPSQVLIALSSQEDV